jgi:carbon-monoxide dehydrogenase large subunit
VATNKAPLGPNRGVGRPPAVLAMEGLIDRAARRLGIDPVEMRMRNFVRPEEFPYKTATGIVWDRAGFIECMKKACETLDYTAARAEQGRTRAAGRLVGIGFGSYAELTVSDRRRRRRRECRCPQGPRRRRFASIRRAP